MEDLQKKLNKLLSGLSVTVSFWLKIELKQNVASMLSSLAAKDTSYSQLLAIADV